MRNRSRSVAFRSRRLSGGAGAWTPADIADCVLAHLWTGATIYTTDGGATVAAVDDPVGRQVAQAGPDGVQTSSGLRPTRKSDGLSLDATDDRFDLSAAVTTGGDFTAYLAGDISGSQNWIPLADADGASGLIRFTDGNLYLIAADNSVPFARAWSPSGPVLVRIRRSGTDIYLTATGLVEAAAVSVASYTVDCAGQRDTVQRSGSAAHRYRDRLIYGRDLTAGERELVEAYFAAQGYSL